MTDRELDRLKLQHDQAWETTGRAREVQNAAWERRQSAQADLNQAHEQQQAAHSAQDEAWQRRQAARDAMDRAFEAKQQAHAIQQRAWDQLQTLRDRNGPRLDDLNRRQEAAHENMLEAFRDASAAHDNHDGAGARAHADDGHRYKDERDGYVSERRDLVADIRAAQADWEPTRGPFQDAKAEFDRARSVFQAAKAAHEPRLRAFKEAQAAFGQAREAYQRAKSDHEQRRREFERAKTELEGIRAAQRARLEVVRGDRQRRQDDDRVLARQAGVPSQYLDDLEVQREHNGVVNFYFGGIGAPDGPGHGHYVLDTKTGDVIYARDPHRDHGAQNFSGQRERDGRRPKGPWTPAASQPPDGGIVEGTPGGLDHIVSLKVNQQRPPYDDVLIADGDYTDDPEGFRTSHDHSWFDPDTDERGYEDRGRYTGPGGSDD